MLSRLPWAQVRASQRRHPSVGQARAAEPHGSGGPFRGAHVLPPSTGLLYELLRLMGGEGRKVDVFGLSCLADS